MDFLTVGGVDLHRSAHRDLLALCIPKQDLEPHLCLQVHPEPHRPVRPRLRPRHRRRLHQHPPAGVLLMPLVKRRHCQIAHRKVRGEAIVKGEVDGVVVDALVLVPIIELQVEIQAAISGVEGSVERRGVKVLDRAGGVGGAEAEPHEEGSEAQSEDEAAAAAAASASGLRHGGR